MVPTYFGMAFHGSSVHFFYKDAVNPAAWTLFATVPRQAWMDAPASTTLSFGVVAMSSDSAFFDDFNVVPITLANLP